MFVGINGVAGSEQSNNAYKIGQVVVNEIKMALAVGKTIDEIEEAEHNLVENVEDILQKVLDRYSEGKYTVFNFSEESKEKFSFAVAGSDAENFKEIVRNAVAASNISDESKRIIDEILGPKN